MGIFNSLSSTKSKLINTTRNFYFGASEAEGENVEGASLLDYFEDYLNILEQLQVGKFIFTGRKGVGKSAIAKFIKDKSDISTESYAKILRINDFELEKFIQTDDTQESKEKLVFEWLLLINTVKLVVSNDLGKYTNEYDKLKKFLDINSGIVNIDEYEIVTGEKNKGGEVNFGGLKHSFGGVFKNYFKTNVNKAPFYKLIPPLREILKIILDYPVNKEIEFWILFDDLDINFNINSEYDNDKVMELIRIAKFYNNEIFNNNNAKTLIFIRDDIRENLLSKYADSAKIFASYEILISWYKHSLIHEKEDKIALKQLANKRIEINFNKKGIMHGSDAWETLFEPIDYFGKTSFKYILDFTFYRPRDIISFLSTMSNEDFVFPLGRDNVKTLIKKFIAININEIKSELKLFFKDNEITIIFNKLFPFIIDKQMVSLNDLLKEIDNYDFNIGSERVIDLLNSYSLIILRDKRGNLYFNHRANGDLENIDENELEYTLPKYIYHNYRNIN